MIAPDQTNREKEIFEAALDRAPGEQRQSYLEAACGDDMVLLARIRALLDADELGEGFLPGLPRETSTPITEKPGDHIGRYRLLQQIGEGGCGIVYMAEQETPVRRKVALKVIKAGMDTRQVMARFEAERQALALMDHPNIARVLDAGATDTGRPYFIMELVGGIKITDYCEKNNLTTSQRLEQYIQVCHAIQHAHQKGVIHRDIKPSNVLVAEQDGVPVPKVIDFGIAKATQGKLTDQTVFTAFEQFLGTPAYMSPEQAQLGGMDVDTRSDIYSLGVLLYELLTGKTPFDAKELLAAGLEAMRRTIQEKEPPTPSTRLKQELAAQQVQTSDQSKIQKPKAKVANDLDWIVMKCLEKDRARRYETANGLARDIERHLNNEPVMARPPSPLYRFEKLVRRNKLVFSAAGAALAALLLGLGLSTWLFFRERAGKREQGRLRQAAVVEKAKAQTEAAKSQQVARLLTDMLKGVGPSKALGRDTMMLKEILDRTAERISTDLTNQPEVELELREILAGTYWDLGQFKAMEQMALASLRLSRERFGEKSAETARAIFRLGLAQRLFANDDQAEITLREAFDLQKALPGSCSRQLPDTAAELGFIVFIHGKFAESEDILRQGLRVANQEFGVQTEVAARLLRLLGWPLMAQGRHAEALASQREALAIFRKLFDEEHPEVARALHDLGVTLWRQGNLDEAEARVGEALAMRRRLLGNDHDETGDSLGWMSGIMRNLGKLEEAEKLAREAYAAKKKAIGHAAIAAHLANLVGILKDEGKDEEVVALCRDEWPSFQAVVSTIQKRDLADLRVLFVESLCLIGKLEEAQSVLREVAEGGNARILNDTAWFVVTSPYPEMRHLVGDALVYAENAVAATGRTNAVYLDTLATSYAASGQFTNAARVEREAIALQRDEDFKRDDALRLRLFEAGETWRDEAALGRKCGYLLKQGRLPEAEKLLRECLALREKQIPDDWSTFNTKSQLGGALLGQKKYSEAAPFLLAGYEGMKEREVRIPAVGKPRRIEALRQIRLKQALERLEQYCQAVGQVDQAAEWKRKLTDFDRAAQIEK